MRSTNPERLLACGRSHQTSAVREGKFLTFADVRVIEDWDRQKQQLSKLFLEVPALMEPGEFFATLSAEELAKHVGSMLSQSEPIRKSL